MTVPPRSSSRQLTWRRFAVLALVAVLTGCSSPIKVSRENDRLRRSNLELGRKVEALEEAGRLRLAQIKALEQRAAAPSKIAGAELPQFVAVRFGRHSGPIDTDRDDIDDALRIYVQTVDQRGRFMVVAGRARLQAVAVEPGSDPRIVVEHTFEPAEFDDRYRSGLTGTHYTLLLPLPAPLPSGLADVTVKLAFTDAATGVQFSCQEAYDLRAGGGTPE